MIHQCNGILKYNINSTRINVIYCLDRERREESKDMKVTKSRKKGVEDKI
jgi:hypothetical protein